MKISKPLTAINKIVAVWTMIHVASIITGYVEPEKKDAILYGIITAVLLWDLKTYKFQWDNKK